MEKSFKRVLIANRGEIAVRIIRACRDLGIETLQVYSEADRHSLAVQLADRAVCIGPARSDRSYLNAEFIVSAALVHQADAIHPGYGFLSENAGFAKLCEKEGIAFIGPSAQVISLMGDKAMARRMAEEAGIPITPGSPGIVEGVSAATAIAATLGYPVIIKAAAGGGGRGMRIVWNDNAMQSQYVAAAREAKAAFHDDSIYIEKYLTEIRHIEVQVLSDGETVLHLGERDCSIQRRNQKLIEESPSPRLAKAVRAGMAEAAICLCKHVNYKNAGTVEFIFDERSGHFYFMEMNTRIQVEHPVTEFVTGIDLVKEQIRIAQGNRLTMRQSEISFRGHAIECRINAEDADNGFAPCPGTVNAFHAPGGPGIRVDSHLYAGYQVPSWYDSLLAKVIVWGATREEAISRMRRALAEMKIEGIKTTIPFHERMLCNADFERGNMHTKFVEDVLLQTQDHQ